MGVPTYELYGETAEERPDFRFHCETLYARSSLHRFEIGLHRHESFFQLLYIQGGAGDAVLEGATHALRPPAVVTVPPGASHGFRFSKDIAGLIVTVLSASLAVPPGGPGALGRWLARPRVVALEGGDAGAVAAALSHIGAEHEDRRPGRAALLEACFTAALVLCARLGLEGSEEEHLPRNENERRIGALVALIDRHAREHRPLSFYAAALGLSPTHLSRIVRLERGATVQELIERRLTDLARRDLVFTPSPVQAVAASLGFADPAYFSRFFARRTGMTPRAFRLAERARLAAPGGRG